MNVPKVLDPELMATRARWSLSARAARRLAWCCWAVSLVQAVAGWLLAALNHLSPERFFAEYVVSQSAAALVFATVGVLIVSRRSTHTVGWLFCAAGVGFGLTSWIGQYIRYTLVTQPGALPGAQVFTWVAIWSWVPITALVVIFLPLLFPDGRLPSARWRPVLGLALVATTLLTLSLALSPDPRDSVLPEVTNPFAPPGLEPLLPVIEPLAQGLMLASLAGAVAAPVVRFRRAAGRERQQLKWFAYATALLVAAYVAATALHLSGRVTNPLPGGILNAVTLPLLAMAVGIAILRHRLYDIDILINRTLVYGILTSCIAGVYAFIVGYLGMIFNTGGNLLISLVATGVVAVLFAPLRDWLQRSANRLLYGERDEPYAVLARLGRRLESALVPDAVLPTVVASVKDALKLPYVAVALKRDETFSVAAADGTPAGDPLVLPLSFQGEVVGELRVCPRAPGEQWLAAEQQLLADLAHHAGVAVHGVRIMAELQHARERLVLAREEERRRIRRDLHDDVAPSLAALALTAATVGELIPTDPQAAVAAVAKLQAAIRATIGNVRRLVYDLRPPTLDELGLIEAIREQAARYNEAPATLAEGEARNILRVTLDFPSHLPPLPAAVEVAAYRIIQEGLLNISRHAQAHTCTIRLACPTEQALAVEVIDDGVGLPEHPDAGVGLRSMRERAAELGGVCEIAGAAPRGTRVTAWFPISSDHEAEVNRYEPATYSHR